MKLEDRILFPLSLLSVILGGGHAVYADDNKTSSINLDFRFTTSVIYPEDHAKPSPFGIDLGGDSQIVPMEELQKFEE